MHLTTLGGTAVPTLLNAACQQSCASMPGVSRRKLADAGVAVTPGVIKPNDPAHDKLASLGSHMRVNVSVSQLHGHLGRARNLTCTVESAYLISVENTESVLTERYCYTGV